MVKEGQSGAKEGKVAKQKGKSNLSCRNRTSDHMIFAGTMVSRSILLQLPRDILHSVYSEWLASWRDLSCLDVGCVAKEDRETWLCSFCELKIRRVVNRLSDKVISGWYEWVFSRKVFVVENFPVIVGVLGNLAVELDYGSYCPALRSIEVEDNMLASSLILDSNMLEERLSLFLRACIHLEGVTFIKTEDGIEIGLFTCARFIIREILANHLSSMRDLELCPSQTVSEESVDEIMSILHEKTTPLKRLCLSDAPVSLQKLSRWLSSVAMHLEELEIGNYVTVNIEEFQKGDILSYVGGACPQLRSLRLGISGLERNRWNEFPISKLLQLYELCPHLIAFTSYNTISKASIRIEVKEDLRELYYEMYELNLSMEANAILLDCVCLVMQRSPWKLSLSSIPFCMKSRERYNRWVLFKSKLSPYLTDLYWEMSESILIEALKELPRLKNLAVIETEENCFSDLGLLGLMEYGHGLRSLIITYFGLMKPKSCRFSDDMMSKMIESCPMLENLRIPCAGCKSMLAVKDHPKLREVSLENVNLAKDEIESILLGDEREGGAEQKYVWKLHNGNINGQGFKYLFDKATRSWKGSNN
eukprot:scaffold3999_cov196-Ochromonas_danica.AAC.5